MSCSKKTSLDSSFPLFLPLSLLSPFFPPLYRQEFFNDLYHRFLLSPKSSMKAMCLQAMAIVYGQCYDEIGPFNDTSFMVRKLEEVSQHVAVM